MLMKEAEPVMGTEEACHPEGTQIVISKGHAVGLGAACLLSQTPALFSPIHKLYVHSFVARKMTECYQGTRRQGLFSIQ